MAVIDPDGLFGGDRLAALSDKARLYWPWLYTASNGFARLELSPRAIIQRCFGSWSDPMSEEQLRVILSEYSDNYLLFVYEANGQQWIQFDTPEKLLKRHKTKRDASSPPPPPEARQAFDTGYMEWKRSKSFNLHDPSKSRELFGKNARGKGIGKGIGEGEGTAARAPEPPSPEATHPPPVSSSAPIINQEIENTARRVIMAHPRSLLRKTRFSECAHSHMIAVLQAMYDEAAAAECSPAKALDMILERVEMHAREVPEDQYRYFKEVDDYMAHHEYRLEPNYFNRGGGSNGGSSAGSIGGSDKPTERGKASRSAIDEAVDRRRRAGGTRPPNEAGAVHEAKSGAASRDAGYVPPGMGGDIGGVRHGGVRGRPMEGAP